MDTTTASIRVHIEMDDDFEPGARTAAAVAELAAALDEEHGSDHDVAGFSTVPLRVFTFGFATTAQGSPNVLMDPNPPTGRFATTTGGSPNV